MTVNEFLKTTSDNFQALLEDGLTGKEIIRLLQALSLYAAILCKAEPFLPYTFFAQFMKAQDEIKKAGDIAFS